MSEQPKPDNSVLAILVDYAHRCDDSDERERLMACEIAHLRAELDGGVGRGRRGEREPGGERTMSEKSWPDNLFFDLSRKCEECGCAPLHWDHDGQFAHEVECKLGRLTYEALKAQEARDDDA